MMQWRIPFTKPTLDARDAEAVAATIVSGWISSGEKTVRFEEDFADFIGRQYGLACHSGAAALELALGSLNIGPGDEVIVPSLTFTATAAAVRSTGATVVFADITAPSNLTLSPEATAEALTLRTKAVIFVPHSGYAGSLLDVLRVCDNACIPLIEDACHAPGATSSGRRVGAVGHLATFSFHATKNITTAEGGMVVFDDPRLLASMQERRSHGVRRVPEMTPDGADYVVSRVAPNCRMSDLVASLGLAQLERLAEFNRERVALSQRYDELLIDMDELIRPFAADRECGAGHLYTVLLPNGSDRRAVRLALRERGIETSVHYVPLHDQPAYAYGARTMPLPITEIIAPRLVSLPLFVGMTVDEQYYVVDALRDTLHAMAADFVFPESEMADPVCHAEAVAVSR